MSRQPVRRRALPPARRCSAAHMCSPSCRSAPGAPPLGALALRGHPPCGPTPDILTVGHHLHVRWVRRLSQSSGRRSGVAWGGCELSRAVAAAAAIRT
jgi:hypothetical protein